MSEPTIKQTKPVADPELADLLDLHKKDIFLSLNCHAIATVQSFDPSQLTITATVNYKKTFFQRAADGLYNPVLIDYPILLDIPVIVIGGGDGCLTMPISKGDQALILFNDRDIDNWFSGKSNGSVATARLHSFSDGIALVGLHSKQNPIEDYSTDKVELRKPGTETKVSLGDKIKIINAMTDLKTVLDDLIDQIKAITTSGGQSVSGASQAALELIKLEIGELLES